MNDTLNLSAGPHVRDRWTTEFIMRVVFLTLVPTAVIGIAVNGVKALLVILVSIASCFLTELLFDKLTHRPDTWKDGSACVTGMLLALSLSPDTPLYAPVLGGIFAILVVKCCFGGLGKNFINPALAARCFLLISFGSAMTVYKVDGVSSATPVAELLAGRAVNVSEMFLGTAGGVIGASAVALLAGGLVLWALDIIHGEICFSVVAGFALFIGLFGGQGFDPAFLLAHICGGGVLMGAFYMATDYVTSPVSKLGQMTYGCLIGVLGGLFRLYGSSADSFSYSVIIGNLLTPLIDTYVFPKPFAYRKKALLRQNGVTLPPLHKRIPRPVIALAIITLVAGLALSGVYSMTRENIEAQEAAAALAAFRAVIPAAETFETSPAADAAIEALEGGTYGSGFGKSRINQAVIGRDAAGNVVGYAVSATNGEGYDGDITLSLGIAPDGSTLGIAFTELNETPGMGMRCDEEAFKSQFAGKSVTSFVVLKDGGAAKPEEIDAVSGCTTSSRAVTNAVNAALDFCRNQLMGGE
ncbi:MAG: RnfABCDGE type electron transport complex subunit D [bacterium]